MKKILPVLFCFIFFQSKAAIQNVNVSNFQFSPNSFNVVVGDVIHFVWVNGGHTTSSITVPIGAIPWDAPLNSLPGNDFFDYTVTTAGSYSFQCNIHPIVMQGSFVASGAAPVTLSAFSINTKNNRPFLTWTTQTEMDAD